MKIIAIVVVILLAGILAVGAFNAGSMNKDSVYNQKLLSASGEVTKMVAPDKVDIVLAVETLNVSAQASQSENATIADRVVLALKKVGVSSDQIKTQGYSVNEEFEWNDLTKKSESKGYRTTNSIEVTLTDTKLAGAVVDAAVNAGANRVSGITFGLTKEKELAVRTAALSEAASVAKAKAQSIASGLGVVLGKVYSVNESGFYYTPNYSSYEMTKIADAGSAAPTPISAGDVQVDASVSVAFELN